MTLLKRHQVGSPADGSIDALIKEARQRRRRRRLVVGGIAFIVVAVIALILSPLVQGGAARHHTSPRATLEKQLSPLRPTSRLPPVQPGPLAVGSNGDLYIADGLRNQILERQSDGRFRVVVGNGKTGFSGDGGPATNAEINDPQGMAVAPDGTLYFADSRNGRIRAVSPDGIITTVAGNGQAGWVADGTPALSASLTPVAVALTPTNQLYVADQDEADQGEVLRRNVVGTLTHVLGMRTTSVAFVNDSLATDTPAFDPDALAFDSADDLFVAGYMDKALLMVSPQGTATYPLGTIGALYPRGNGGLVTAPNGSVLAMDELSVMRVSPSGAQLIRSFSLSFLKLNGFSPDGIAVASNGTIYLDTDYGNGFAFVSAIVELTPNGKAELLGKALRHSISLGSGAARALLNEALLAAQRAGPPTAWLEVVEAQTRSRRFYEREGWRLDESIAPTSIGLFRLLYYRRDENLLSRRLCVFRQARASPVSSR